MVDLVTQYNKIKPEVDAEMSKVLASMKLINGPAVGEFAEQLQDYLGVKHVIPCANGTDALQVAFMALGLNRGTEVLVPSWTYVATVEVIALLDLKPVFVEVEPDTFNLSMDDLKAKVTENCKAIVPVHLYGQCANMTEIMEFAKAHDLKVIEDTAQALGSDYHWGNGKSQKAGTIGDIGTTSFFPSKNLGCFGDGGALMTNDSDLAVIIKQIANHGQSRKYVNERIGVNSRLDTLQAAVLKVKLKHLDEYVLARQSVAARYDQAFKDLANVDIPARSDFSTHGFHQYTLKLAEGVDRDAVKGKLQEVGVPSMIYYPIPNHLQEAYQYFNYAEGSLPVTEDLAKRVISLPVHTEMDEETSNYIIEKFSEIVSN